MINIYPHRRIKVKGQFLQLLTDLFARPAIPPGLSAKERFPSSSPTGKIPATTHFFPADSLRTDIAYLNMNK
jgi:hypothetical protein